MHVYTYIYIYVLHTPHIYIERERVNYVYSFVMYNMYNTQAQTKPNKATLPLTDRQSVSQTETHTHTHRGTHARTHASLLRITEYFSRLRWQWN